MSKGTKGSRWHRVAESNRARRDAAAPFWRLRRVGPVESHFDRIKARLLARSTEVRSVPGGIERDGTATSSGVTGGERAAFPPQLKLDETEQ